MRSAICAIVLTAARDADPGTDRGADGDPCTYQHDPPHANFGAETVSYRGRAAADARADGDRHSAHAD
ncbi:MAG: hypothetical protein HY675_17435 [Chloroflexi bacterium]|nr:hypothetical protein [Chloroflexota bacterium]